MQLTSPSRVRFVLVGLGLAVLTATGIVAAGQAKRDFDVSARKYAFRVSGNDAAEIHVFQNDLVHINFSTEDIPHSFTIEDTANSHYRVMRRAEPGRPVSFDFQADTVGRFRFSCTLSIDDKCREMHGTIIVEPKK